MTSYEDYSAARSRWFHERDTIWKPLLEAAEKYAYLDPLGTAELQDAIHAAREAMGEEK